MKKILDINTVMELINQKKDFYQKMGSKMYVLTFVTILNAPLRTTIKLVNSGMLYYDEKEG